LIALQYHEVKINIDFRPIGECLWACKQLDATSGTVSTTNAYQQSLVAASLYVDYIFLDTDERRKMAQNPHEYLIEQVQFTGDESVGSSSNKIKLNFNHPCKELIWVVQPDSNVDYCSSLEGGSVLYRALGAQPFNYTDGVDALPNAIHAFGGKASTADVINDSGLFQMDLAGDAAAEASGNWEAGVNSGKGANLSDAGTFVLAETAKDMHCWGENPVVTAKLQLNGQDRISERDVLTLMLFNLTNTTPVPLTLVSTYTHSPFALRSTNLLAHATSPELTTLSFNLSFLPPQLPVPPLPRYVYTPLTTTSSAS